MNNQIQINKKLMEREDHLVDISHLEKEINQILGDVFPFTPVDLPSRQKRKKARSPKKPRVEPPMRLRKLDEESEDAYRIIYLEGDKERTEIHLDTRALTTLINTPLPNLTISSIETVKRGSEPDQWIPLETLYTEN